MGDHQKTKKGAPLINARLVAQGFEEEWNNECSKDSPTCDKNSFRPSVALIASLGGVAIRWISKLYFGRVQVLVENSIHDRQRNLMKAN